MRKFILTLLILFFANIIICNISKAEITVKEYMDYDFLRTQGYSDDIVHSVEINKARTFGEELPSRLPRNPIARGWVRLWQYIDPADDVGDFGTHEIHIKNTPWDY